MRLLGRFRRFWTAEEVPRWFGLCLIVVYVGGLWGVGYLTYREVHAEAAASAHDQTQFAFRMLVDRLSEDLRRDADGPIEADDARAFQRTLREFSSNFRADWVRIVDPQGLVVASTLAGDVGSAVSETISAVPGAYGFEYADVSSVREGREGWFVRAPLPNAIVQDIPRADPELADSPMAGTERPRSASSTLILKSRTVLEPAVLYIEALFPTPPATSASLITRATVPTAILLACGVLFVMFRRLRVQLRSASQISDRLRDAAPQATREERIGADIRSLQIADANDEVGTAWNQIVDLVVELQEELERARASSELNNAMGSSIGALLAQALNALTDGFMYVSPDGRIEYTNAIARRLAAWQEEDIREAAIEGLEATPIGDKILDVVRGATRPDGTFESVSELISVEGDGSSYRVWVAPLAGDSIQGGAMIVVRDVSQQVRSEQAREEFVVQVTHALRTPLTNIRAYAETLTSGVIDDPKAIADCYNVITKETRRLSRLIEDILSVSQMEVGCIQLELGDVDLRALLTDTVRDLRGLADEKDMDLQLVLPPKMDLVHADRDKLAVVLTNLIGNSLKYTPAGGSVIVGCQVKAEQAVITVKDNGIGIDPRDHVRVFEKFQRSEDPDVQNETGSGIGLFTAREIVRRHGGDIDLISKKGEGATFVVRLPHTASRAESLSVAQEIHSHG